MALDSFRRRLADPERPNYRFFPNRTRTQTLYISWGVLLGGAVLGLLMLDYSNKRQAELSAYYADLERKGNFFKGSQAQVYNQNAQLQEIFHRARRRSLGLSEWPKPALEIQSEDEKKDQVAGNPPSQHA